MKQITLELEGNLVSSLPPVESLQARLRELRHHLRGVNAVRGIITGTSMGSDQYGLTIFLCVDEAQWAEINQAGDYTYTPDTVRNIAVGAALIEPLVESGAVQVVPNEALVMSTLDEDGMRELGIELGPRGVYRVPRLTPQGEPHVWGFALNDGGDMYDWYNETSGRPFAQIVIVPDVAPQEIGDTQMLLVVKVSQGWNFVGLEPEGFGTELTFQMGTRLMFATDIG